MTAHPSSNLVIDPVCGMSLDRAQAAATVEAKGETVYFCSLACRDQFQAEPDRYPPVHQTDTPDAAHAHCTHEHEHMNVGSTATLGVPVSAALAGALALLIIYFSLLTLVSGWAFTVQQFEQFWPFITALAIGFGIQVGLFMFLHRAVHAMGHTMDQTGKVVAVTGTTSGAAMVSCCTHYLVNLLPALGTTGLVSLVGQYQVELFWFGLLANLAGIAYMGNRVMAFSHEKGHGGHTGTTAMVALMIGMLGLAVWGKPAVAETALQAQVNSEGGVTVTVTPQDLAADQPWRFLVDLSTHSVTLDQDVAASAVLVTVGVQEAPAEQWIGDPPGGHHRKGTLVFSPPSPLPQTVTLKIRGIGAAERVFVWQRPGS